MKREEEQLGRGDVFSAIYLGTWLGIVGTEERKRDQHRCS